MTQAPQPIAYAVHGPSGRSRVLAASGVTLAGLILVGFGGCFLIGVMVQLAPALMFGPTAAKVWTSADWLLHVVLYLLAGACFACGGWLVWRGVASLLRVIREHD